jgi:hypothetical protein
MRWNFSVEPPFFLCPPCPFCPVNSKKLKIIGFYLKCMGQVSKASLSCLSYKRTGIVQENLSKAKQNLLQIRLSQKTEKTEQRGFYNKRLPNDNLNMRADGAFFTFNQTLRFFLFTNLLASLQWKSPNTVKIRKYHGRLINVKRKIRMRC